MNTKIWSCKIGEVEDESLPPGADLPMREAIRRAYVEITGHAPDFIFSGWGAELTDSERAVVEDRLPIPEPSRFFEDGLVRPYSENADLPVEVEGSVMP